MFHYCWWNWTKNFLNFPSPIILLKMKPFKCNITPPSRVYSLIAHLKGAINFYPIASFSPPPLQMDNNFFFFLSAAMDFIHGDKNKIVDFIVGSDSVVSWQRRYTETWEFYCETKGPLTDGTMVLLTVMVIIQQRMFT